MNQKIDEFMNGGSSESATIGYRIGKFLKVVLVLFAALVLIAIGEIGQFMRSCQDVRTAAINKWILENPDQKNIADSYIENCLIAKKSDFENLDKEFNKDKHYVDVYECGNKMGAESLVRVIKVADATLISAAWPLSLANWNGQNKQ